MAAISSTRLLMPYKPDIDGLRALAVLAVVLFHFEVNAVSGGFVGVDVFYVISGYLITSILAADLDRGEFTFGGFYARRARRILPASLAVLAAVALFGWRALPPTDLIVLGNSIVATVFFASNFFFLGQADYFGADSQTLHLLHTWSLAVEEQFYLLFPLLLFALRKAGRNRTFWVVAAVAFASLALSVLGTAKEPALAFYLLPARAWELLVGALIALRPLRLSDSPRLSTALTLLGFALLGVSFFSFGTDTPFPGIAAALPTLGAALPILASASAARWVRWPITNRVMIGIGKISYSMYLWHWPLVVAYRTTFGGSSALAPLLFFPLLPVSYASYRFIEQPLRNPRFWARRRRAAMALAAPLALAGFGFVAVRTHGLVIGLDARAAAIAEAPKQRQAATTGGPCFSTTTWDKFAVAECLEKKPGRRSIFLWGDSVAAHYSLGLRAAARGTDIDILQATMAGCSPSLGWNPRNRPLCKGRNDAVLGYIKQHPPSLVLLAGQWPWNDRPDNYKKFLANSLAALRELGQRAVVLGPPIEYTRPLPELIVQHLLKKEPVRTPELINGLTKKIDGDLKNGAVDLSGATLISIFRVMCSGWECPTLTPEGAPLQWDTQHLTREGSLMVGKKLFPLLEAELDGKAGK